MELALETTGLHPPARVLDLACGAGRHLAPFHEKGFEATGGDLSLPLLKLVHQRQCDCRLTRLDMRRLPFQDSAFDLVASFFTAFGYFESDEENLGVLREVARVLRPGGWFFFDFLNAEIARRSLAGQDEFDEQVLHSGETWRIHRHLSRDGLRAKKIQRKFIDGELHREIQENVRLFTAEELVAGLDSAGLAVHEIYGDYKGNSFDLQKSPRLIFCCQRVS